MRLHPGEEAPNFTILDVYGRQVILESYKDQYVLLCFFRYAGCPFCQLILRKIIENYSKFQSVGLHVVAFFQSPKQAVIEYAGRYDPPFPIIADPDESIYTLYGVESSLAGVIKGVLDVPKLLDTFVSERMSQGKVDGDFFLMPGYFLVGPPDNTIHKALYATSFTDDGVLHEAHRFVVEHVS